MANKLVIHFVSTASTPHCIARLASNELFWYHHVSFIILHNFTIFRIHRIPSLRASPIDTCSYYCRETYDYHYHVPVLNFNWYVTICFLTSLDWPIHRLCPPSAAAGSSCCGKEPSWPSVLAYSDSFNQIKVEVSWSFICLAILEIWRPWTPGIRGKSI